MARGYIGFKAEYKVRDEIVEKIEATLTLLPRHSILYLPISKLTIGGDRLFLVARVRRLSGDVHAIKSGTYRFSKGMDREEEYLRERVSIDGEVFDLYYKRDDDKQKMLRHLKNLPVKKVKHVSITPETRVVYVYTTPDAIEAVIPEMFKMSRDFV